MQVTLAHVGARAKTGDAMDALTRSYLERCAAFGRCSAEAFRSEQALLEWLKQRQGRTPAFPVLLDSRGKSMASEPFAQWLGEQRDQGVQQMVFAIGPADGWSAEALAQARLKLSLGPFTLAHALARLVMAEQLYRASTILTGHPYHTGH